MTLTSLAGEYADLRIPTSNISLLLDQDVNQKFIGKKTNRDKQKKPFNPKEGETVENEDVLTPPFETPKEIKPKENKPAGMINYLTLIS